MLAFVGLSGRSVKIVVPFVRPTARCRKKRSRPVCFMLRLISWRCGITSRSWAALYR
ncbi:MAG: BT4734/BF3469 family protein [Parabacteroides merdae]